MKIGLHRNHHDAEQGKRVCHLGGMISKNDTIDSRARLLWMCEEEYASMAAKQGDLSRTEGYDKICPGHEEAAPCAQNHLEALEHSHQAEKSIVKHYEAMVSYLDKRLKMNLKNMKEKVASDEALNKKVENIITAPSLGFTSVITVIAETNGFALIQNRKQLTSYAGFDVKDNQSGNVEGTSRISKKATPVSVPYFYMPAVHI